MAYASKPRVTPPPPPVRGARWVPLTREKFALVDAKDFGRVNALLWQWCPTKHGPGYAHRIFWDKQEKRHRCLRLHRFIMMRPACDVDHRNGNTLDCRRRNLRLASEQHNTWNRSARRVRKHPGLKGVRRKTNRWEAWLCGKYLGMFHTEEAAGRAYDAAARKRFGKFACVNFPRRGERAA